MNETRTIKLATGESVRVIDDRYNAVDVVWGDSSSHAGGQLIDQVYLELDYVNNTDESIRYGWYLNCTHDVTDITFSSKPAKHLNGSNWIASALVMVRIIDVGGYPLCQCYVMDVICDSSMEVGTPAIPTAPQKQSLFRTIQYWALEQYGGLTDDPDQDMCDTVECKMDITYDLGGEG